MTSPRLTIAFVFDLEAPWLALGYSERPGINSDGNAAIDGTCAGISAAGYNVRRVDGIKTLVKYLASGQYLEWDLVFNIAEGMHGLCREAQVPSLLEAYEIPFTFADAATTALCLDKGRTKMVLEHFGIQTAPFAVIPNNSKSGSSSQEPDRTQRAIECSRHAAALRVYPLFAKPVAEGTSKGVLLSSKIKRLEDLEKTMCELGALYHGQDILLETFLSGREITVGILGTGEDSRVIGANEYVYKKPRPSKGDADPELVDFATDSIKNDEMDKNPHMDTVSADLSDPEVHCACQLALAAWKVLHCRDAGRIDTRYDRMGQGAVPHFMEVNPIPGVIPDWSDLSLIARDNGLPYEAFVGQIVESALARTKNGVKSQEIQLQEDESIVPTKKERWETYGLRT